MALNWGIPTPDEELKSEIKPVEPVKSSLNWGVPTDETKPVSTEKPNVPVESKLNWGVPDLSEVVNFAEGMVAPLVDPTKMAKIVGKPVTDPKFAKALGAGASAVFPLSWIDAIIAGPATEIQKGAPIKDVFLSVPKNIYKKIQDVSNESAIAVGLSKVPFNKENVDKAKSLGDVWGNYYKSVTGIEAPVWYKTMAGVAQIVGLSPLSPEFRKVMDTVGKGSVKALRKTAEGAAKIAKGAKLDYVDFLKGKLDKATYIAKHGKAQWNTLGKLAKEINKESALYGAKTTDPEYVSQRLFGVKRPVLSRPAKPSKAADISKMKVERPAVKPTVAPKVEKAKELFKPTTRLEKLNHAIDSEGKRFGMLMKRAPGPNTKVVGLQIETAIHNMKMERDALIAEQKLVSKAKVKKAHKPAKIESESLIEEAKKYKSAEEFVDSQVKTKNEVLYHKIGSRNIEVIKNPTPRDSQQIAKEFRKEFPQGKGEPSTRTSYDSEGNKYVWRSDKATHDDIEIFIEKAFNVKASQNRHLVLDTQLTNIWNKAHKPEVKTPTITKGATITQVTGEATEASVNVGSWKDPKSGKVFKDDIKFVPVDKDMNVSEYFKANPKELALAWEEVNLKTNKVEMHLYNKESKEHVILPYSKEFKMTHEEFNKFSDELGPDEGATWKNGTVTQYADKPFKIAGEVVKPVAPIQEQQIVEELKNNLIANKKLNSVAYDIIIKKYKAINPKTGKWRKITPEKIKKIQIEIHKESIIAESKEKYVEALKKNPEIKKVYDEVNKTINKRQKDPSRLESRRYFMQKSEIIIGRPVNNVFEDINLILDENLNRVGKDLKFLNETSPNANKLINNPKALERVSQYVASKSTLRNKPKAPEGITADEIALAKGFEKIYEGFKLKVREVKLYEFFEYDKPIAGYSKNKEAIDKAVDIMNTYGKGSKQLIDYLKTQEWGVVGSGYEPIKSIIMTADPTARAKASTITGKGHVRERTDIEYKKQEKDIYQRTVKYIKTMNNLYYVQPKIDALAKMFNDNMDKFQNPRNIKTSLETYYNAVKGYNADDGQMIPDFLTRVYAQAMKTVILPNPVLAFRNLFQNLAFAPDKGMLFDPRNKPLTDEDMVYFEKHVSNMQHILDNYIRFDEKAFPGLKGLTKIAGKLKTYPLSDTVNRRWLYWGTLNKLRRYWDKNANIENLKTKGLFKDLELTEQKYALGLYVKDGLQAMFRYVAKTHVANIHFLYSKSQRSALETGSKMAEVFTNLWLFPRAYWERVAKNVSRVTNTKTSTANRYRSLKVLASILAGSVMADTVYKEITGRRRGPYDPLNLASVRPGGLAMGSANQIFEVFNIIKETMSPDKQIKRQALGRLPVVVSRSADMFIPFYDLTMRGVEAYYGKTHLDRLVIRKMRELIDKEYKLRGGAYTVKRKAIEKWQYFLGGASIDYTIKLREAEESKEFH